MRRLLAVLVMTAILVGCGGGSTTPASQTSAVAATSPLASAELAPSTAPAPSVAASVARPVATATPAEPSPTLDVPTPAPTITAQPTATAFPLETGWWDDAVCYEVFVRSFYDSDGNGIGDLNGLIEKLDYISDGDPATQTDLGASCIWLMPVAESDSYHGYDVVDYYTIEQDYGTNDDFKRLIEAAHQRNIKVVIDLVINHTSSQHPWFKDAANNPDSPYRDWYIWSKDDPGYRGPWNDVAWHRSPVRDEYYYGIFWSGMPDLNYRNPAVTDEAHKISAFWLNEMGADGFRLDAIKHLIENGRTQENTRETHAWLRNYRDFLAETKPGAFTIGEIFGADSRTLQPYYPDQLDTYFQFDVGKNIVSAASTGAPLIFALAVNNATTTLPYQRWAPFLTNHDQERVMTTLGDDVARAKIAATALLTLPGMPFVYYGEEIGMLGTKPDENLRTPMQWTGEDDGGFSSGTPWQALNPSFREANVAAQSDDPDSLLNLYRQLIHLHSAQPALSRGSFGLLQSSDRSVVAFVRVAEQEAVLVVLNFGTQAAENATLTAEATELAAGSYTLEALLGTEPGAPLTVADGGAFADFVPLPSLEPQTGYIFKLVR